MNGYKLSFFPSAQSEVFCRLWREVPLPGKQMIKNDLEFIIQTLPNAVFDVSPDDCLPELNNFEKILKLALNTRDDQCSFQALQALLVKELDD